jgi:hypothetical protein
MSWRDLPSSPNTLAFTADGTVDLDDVRRYGHFVAAPSSADITLTLDSPLEDIRGFNFFVTNDNGTYDVIVACTDGFLQDGDSVTVQPGDTVWIHCNEDNDGDLRWLTIVPMAVESIQDAVGAMLDSGGTATHTGMTATYQDATGDIDYAVTYGTEASTACEGDDARLPTAWEDISSGLTVAYSEGGTPASVTVVAMGKTVNEDMAEVFLDFSTADGDDKTPTTITMPAGWIPDDVDAKIPCTALESIGGGAYANVVAYVEAEDDTEANRVITLVGATQWADAGAARLIVSARYPLPTS